MKTSSFIAAVDDFFKLSRLFALNHAPYLFAFIAFILMEGFGGIPGRMTALNLTCYREAAHKKTPGSNHPGGKHAL